MALKIILLITACTIFFSCRNDNRKFKEVIIKENKPNLDSLLASKDTTEIILTIRNYINNLTIDDGLNHLTEAQKNFYYIQELEDEVNNGGFDQYFYNSSGDNAHETLLALKTIRANNCLKLMENAVSEFPDHTVPKERVRRQEILSKIEKEAQKVWDNLDNKFYTYPDNLDSLNLIYIKANRNNFNL